MTKLEYDLFLDGKLYGSFPDMPNVTAYLALISNDQWRVIEIKGQAVQ